MVRHRKCMLSNSPENCNATGSEQICQDVQIIEVGKAFPLMFTTGLWIMATLRSARNKICQEDKILSINILTNIKLHTHEAEYRTVTSTGCWTEEDLLHALRALEKGLKYHTSIYTSKPMKYAKLEGGKKGLLFQMQPEDRQAKTYAPM